MFSCNDRGLSAVPRALQYLLVMTLVVLPLTVILSAPPPASAQTVKINFQPRNVTVPAGYLADSGALYGSRGNGYSYGWTLSHTGDTYYYEPFPWTPNPYWSHIFMQPGPG